MNVVKVILRSVAFLIGATASCGVCVAIYGEFYGGSIGIIPMPILLPAIIGGVLVLISQRQAFVRDPWMAPSGVFAACAFFYYLSLPERITLYEFGNISDSSWLAFVLSILGYFGFISFGCLVVAFVYHGTYAFLSSLGRALSRNNRNA
jgi:hypothetical protein